MNSCSPHFYSVIVNPHFICFVSVYECTEHMPHLFAQGLEPGITIVLETPSFLQSTKLQLVSFLGLEFNPCTVFLIQNPLEPSSALLKYPSHLSSVWKIEFFVLFCFDFWLFHQLDILLQCNRLPCTEAFPCCRAISIQASVGWKVKVSTKHVTARWAKCLEENPIYWHPFSALYTVSKNCWCYWGSFLVNCWNHTVPQHKTCPVSF